MKLTYYGHSCFGVEVAGKTLLFDPFITGNELAKHIDVQRVRADYLLISHGHADHIADAVTIGRKTGATAISNFEIVEWLWRQGHTKGHPMNHGGKCSFDFGSVKYVNAVHSSSLPDGAYGGNPGGFVVETAAGHFYYSGDTALTLDMKIIGERTALRFAVFPIGDTFTMGIEDALEAARWVRCNRVVGVHYDTFPPIRLDRDRAQALAKQANIQLDLVPIGQTIEL